MFRTLIALTLALPAGCSTFFEPTPGRWETQPLKRARLGASDPLKIPSIPALAAGTETAPKPEEVEQKLSQAVDEWFYGPGLGRTMLNVGTVILFPPYVLYLAGNAGLTVAGYDPLYITDAIPEEPRQDVLGVYDAITSVPGEIASAAAGRTPRTAR